MGLDCRDQRQIIQMALHLVPFSLVLHHLHVMSVVLSAAAGSSPDCLDRVA